MRSITASALSILATMVLFFAISRLIYTQPSATARVINRPQLTLLKEFKPNKQDNNNRNKLEPPPQQDINASYPGINKPQLSKSKLSLPKRTFSMNRPAFEDNLSFNGPFIGTLGENTPSNQSLTPLIRIPPVYPRRAAAKGIEGWVKVEFTVLETGDVSDVIILDSKPRKIFNRSAIDAISSWKFKPEISNGKPIQQRATQIITFKLSQ